MTYNETIRLVHALTKVAKDDVAVFRDNGWGDDPEGDARGGGSYFIIIDGHGQNEFAYITKKVFDELRENDLIGDNVYGGFKDRGYHQFDLEKLKSPEWWKLLVKETPHET